MTVNISGVSILNGNTPESGGGILNEYATLTLTDSVVSQNSSILQGGGIANINGILHVTDSLFADNATTDGNDAVSLSTECGGAIYNGPTSIATVDNSVFSNNSAPWAGGGICVDEGAGTSLTVTDSTFTGNTANGYLTSDTDTAGGAIYSNGNGADGAILVERSTFNGNQSATGGAIRSNSHTFNIINSTFYENSAQNGGAVVARTGTMTITNSTFADNVASGEGDSWVREWTATLNVYNSIMQGMGEGTNCFGILSNESGNVNWNGDGCPGLTADPVLQPPAANGSPTTQTMALGTGSWALDRATPVHCPAIDQRGVDRPQPYTAITCDSGAYEGDGEPPANTPPTTELDDIPHTFILTYDFGNTTQVNLPGLFDDAEDGPDLLSYNVLTITNGTAISSTLNGLTNILTLEGRLPLGVPASSDFTIEATDTGGLSIQGTFTAQVDYPPIIDAPNSVVNVQAGVSTGPIAFTYTDDTTFGEGLSCNFSATSSNPAIVPNTPGTFSFGSCNDPSISFTPLTAGSVNITITATDNRNNPRNDTFAVLVTASEGNNPPVAVGDTASVPLNGTVTTLESGSTSVLTNDSDADLDPLTAELVDGPTNATAFTLNSDGTFSYTHDGTQMVADTFTYRACDSEGCSAPATVRIVLENNVRNDAVTIPTTTPISDTAVNSIDPNWYRFYVDTPGSTINVTLQSDYDYDLYLFAPGINDEDGTIRDLAQLSDT